jgi:hypothetical protein
MPAGLKRYSGPRLPALSHLWLLSSPALKINLAILALLATSTSVVPPPATQFRLIFCDSTILLKGFGTTNNACEESAKPNMTTYSISTDRGWRGGAGFKLATDLDFADPLTQSSAPSALTFLKAVPHWNRRARKIEGIQTGD